MSLSYAERARAVVATATGVEVGVLSMTVPVEQHLADADGSLLLCAPRTGSGEPGSPLALAGRFPGPVLTASLTDVTGLPLPDRVCGRVRLTGALTVVDGPLAPGVADHLGACPGRPVMRLVPQRIAIDWRAGRPPRWPSRPAGMTLITGRGDTSGQPRSRGGTISP